jgi:hypothetical protein
MKMDNLFAIRTIETEQTKKHLMMNTKSAKIYIGLVEVLAQDGNLLFATGTIAFVNILALANNTKEFIIKVKEAIDYYGLTYKNIEDVETLVERLKKFEVGEEILTMAKQLKKNPKIDLRLGTFHIWESDE